MLRFGTDMNREFSYRVNNARINTDDADVVSAMTNLIAFDPFDTGRGKLTTARSAQLVYNIETPFNI